MKFFLDNPRKIHQHRCSGKPQHQVISLSLHSSVAGGNCMCVCAHSCICVQIPVCKSIIPKAKIPINWYFAQPALYVDFLTLWLGVIFT